jgi:hypothetical protein
MILRIVDLVNAVFTRTFHGVAAAITVAVIIATLLNVSSDFARSAEFPKPPPTNAAQDVKLDYDFSVQRIAIGNKARFWNAEILIVGAGLIAAFLILPSIKKYDA